MKNEYIPTATTLVLLVSVILVFIGVTVTEAKNSDLKCPIPSGKKYAPYPGSYCVDYYSCDGPDSSALTLSCPGGWMFNDKTQQCASSAEVHCKN